MTDLQRRTIATIQAWVLEEKWSQDQLNRIIRFLNAMQWSEETEKIARAFDGLVKEIIHRDSHLYRQQDEAPLFYLALRPPEARVVERAIHDQNDGRVF